MWRTASRACDVSCSLRHFLNRARQDQAHIEPASSVRWPVQIVGSAISITPDEALGFIWRVRSTDEAGPFWGNWGVWGGGGGGGGARAFWGERGGGFGPPG